METKGSRTKGREKRCEEYRKGTESSGKAYRAARRGIARGEGCYGVERKGIEG